MKILAILWILLLLCWCSWETTLQEDFKNNLIYWEIQNIDGLYIIIDWKKYWYGFSHAYLKTWDVVFIYLNQNRAVQSAVINCEDGSFTFNEDFKTRKFEKTALAVAQDTYNRKNICDIKH